MSLLLDVTSLTALDNSNLPLDQIHALLLRGELNAACSRAAELGLWSHALILASAMDKKTWADIVFKFAHAELDGATSKGHPLAQICGNKTSMKVLYNMIGFNDVGAIASFAPSLEGHSGGDFPTLPAELEKWREVTAVILNNYKGPNDGVILQGVGDKLRVCSRVFAAHTWYHSLIPLEYKDIF